MYSRDRGGNTAVYGDPRTTKSNLIGQVERREGKRTVHIDVWAPAAKLPPWIEFYSAIKQDNPEQRVTFTSYEQIFQAKSPQAAFESFFLGDQGERTIIMDDSKTVLKAKLGGPRAPNFENALEKKLCVTESLGIKMYAIYHGPESSVLRPHFKDVFINGTFASTRNYDKMAEVFDCDIPVRTCMQYVQDLEVSEDQPQFGLHPDSGAASSTLTVDKFLSAKLPKHRFIRIQNNMVCKGMGDFYFRKVNKHAVERNQDAAAATFKTEHESVNFTVLPPGGAFHEHLRKNGRLVAPGSPDAMVDPNNMDGLKYWASRAVAAQFQAKGPAPVNRGFGAGRLFQSLHKCCSHP